VTIISSFSINMSTLFALDPSGGPFKRSRIDPLPARQSLSLISYATTPLSDQSVKAEEEDFHLHSTKESPFFQIRQKLTLIECDNGN
jgi:hypothetical protein